MEIPPRFGHDLRKGAPPEVSADVDGANTFRGETVSQYVQGVQLNALRDPANGMGLEPPKYFANFEDRYMYNPTFESVYAMVPSVPPMLLVLIPAILMAIAVVREKELGSIINFYVTPTGRFEYLLGKQLPYIAIGMINYFILIAMAIIVFGVPIKGSFLMLTLCTLLYVTTTTGIGLVISTFVSSQVAAVFITSILTLVPTIQFSGLTAAGLDARRPRQDHRHDLADDLLHACEQGRFHQGARPRPSHAGRDFPRLLHSSSLDRQHARAREAGEVAMKSLLNILWLGLKELRSLASDAVMLVFVVYAFTAMIYIQATGTSSEVNNASIAFVDEDQSTLAKELINAFYPPRFQDPELISATEVETAMDEGRFMFVVTIPPRFELDLSKGRHPDLQLSIDATAMHAGVDRRGLYQEHRH